MGIVEAVSIENKGIMINGAWYNWSKFSKLSEEEIKAKLSKLRKGDRIKLINLNKSFFDDFEIFKSQDTTEELQKITKDNIDDFKKRAEYICEVADVVISYFTKKYTMIYSKEDIFMIANTCLKYLFNNIDKR